MIFFLSYSLFISSHQLVGQNGLEINANCCLKVMAGTWQLARAKIKANGGKLVITAA